MPAAAALAAQAIGRIGNVLQLVEHEARDEQRAGQEAGAGDIGDAPVDDHAGIQQDGAAFRPSGTGSLHILLPRGAAEVPKVRLKISVLAGDKDRHAQVGEKDRADEGQDGTEGFREQRERECHQRRDEQPGDQPEEPGGEGLRGDATQQRTQSPHGTGGEIGGQDQAEESPDQADGESVLRDGNGGDRFVCGCQAPIWAPQ